MEQVLLETVIRHLRHMIGNSQHGLTRGRSWLTNLFFLYNKVICSIDAGWAVDIVYLDFSKAFDVVLHNHLSEKLTCYGLDRWSILWVGDWLTSHTQRLAVNNSFSNWQPVTSAVPKDCSWVQHCLMSLQVVWTLGSRALWWSLQTTPKCVGSLTLQEEKATFQGELDKDWF